MITVHKFQLNKKGYTDLLIPERSKFLCVKEQNGVIVLYVLLDTDK